MIVCIDPGTWTHGLVVLRDDGALEIADAKAADADVRLHLDACAWGEPATVIVERIQAQGIAGNDIVRTAETSARYAELAANNGHSVVWLYRRHVKQALGIRGKSSDAIVRAVLQEEFGPGAFDKAKRCPKRTNKSHGDDCPHCGGTGNERQAGRYGGVTSHAIQALALWAGWRLGARPVVHERPPPKARP
jgi:hypothetical protein